MIHTGILIPEEWLQTHWFSVLAAFVAINTLIYVILGVIKILPKFMLRKAYRGASRRSETRTIHPDVPA